MTGFLRRLFGNGASTGDRRVEELVSFCEALLAESGEYASMAIARDTLAAYHALDERARESFFDLLVSRYSPAPDAVVRAAAVYQNNPTPEKLAELDAVALDPATVSDTLGVLLKYQDDIARFEGSGAKELIDQVRAELRAAE